MLSRWLWAVGFQHMHLSVLAHLDFKDYARIVLANFCVLPKPSLNNWFRINNDGSLCENEATEFEFIPFFHSVWAFEDFKCVDKLEYWKSTQSAICNFLNFFKENLVHARNILLHLNKIYTLIFFSSNATCFKTEKHSKGIIVHNYYMTFIKVFFLCRGKGC